MDFGGRAPVGQKLRVAENTARKYGYLIGILAVRALRFGLQPRVAATMERRPSVERGTLAELRAVWLYYHRPSCVTQAWFSRRGGHPPRGILQTVVKVRHAAHSRWPVGYRRSGRQWWRLRVVKEARRDGANAILHDQNAYVAHVEVEVSIIVKRRRQCRGRDMGAIEKGKDLVLAALEQSLSIGIE